MKRTNKKQSGIIWTVSIVVIAAVLMGALMVHGTRNNAKPAIATTASTTVPTTTKAPDPVSITIGSTGDILIHTPVLSAHKTGEGEYDFSTIFSYAGSLYGSYDYMVANLEVTCAGDSRAYDGYPCFNAPDNIVTSLAASGVDMLLTANNHSYDTSEDGFWRTQQVVDNADLDRIGTYSEGEKPYLVKNINGIKIGMINYTYETTSSEGRKALNGILMSTATQDYINSFDYNDLETFYTDIQNNINAMYNDGAEAIMVYMHWGDEYTTTPNSYQKQMAQKLCDLGVDVIVGGHPHVIEPIEILSSSVSNKQTVCLYSMGNALSNQLIPYMDIKTGHTEDGLVFETTFTKNSDGSVVLSDIDVTPTWANKFTLNGRYCYKIVPLDTDVDWATQYSDLGRTDEMQSSYNRTTELINEGIEQFKTEYVKKDLRK